MADRHDNDKLEAALTEVKAHRAGLPEPPYAKLVDFAHGRLPPGENAQLEALMGCRPDLTELVEAIRRPDPRLSAAIRRGYRRALREESPGWAFARWAIVPALVVAALLVLLHRPTAQDDGIASVSGAFAWSGGLREGGNHVYQHAVNDALPFTLNAPPGAGSAVLLEVSGRAVEAVQTFQLEPGHPLPRSITFTGDETPSFLVVVYLARPVDASILVADLAAEASRGAPLTATDVAVRKERVMAALRQPSLPRRWVDISEVFQVVSR